MAFPDIAFAIPIEIHGMLKIGRGNELGVAHRASPGAIHGFRRDVAILEDLEGGKKLRPAEVGAPPFKGKGRQRPDDIPAAGEGSVMGLKPPDRRKHFPLNAIFCFETVKQGAVCRKLGFPIGLAFVRKRRTQIVPDGSHEFRLLLVELQHLHIKGDALERRIEGPGTDSRLKHLCAECCQPCCKAILHLRRHHHVIRHRRHLLRLHRCACQSCHTCSQSRYEIAGRKET